MNKQRRDTYRGQTGFFLRGGQGLKCVVVNGAIAKLLSARRADTLTAIYSRRLIRVICISVMFSRNEKPIYIYRKKPVKSRYALIGSRTPFAARGLGLNTTYPLHLHRKGHLDTWRNTYLSQRSLRIAGLKAGSG